MRRCDICSTVIPFGTDSCPNCGYQYKPEIKISDLNRAKQKKDYMSQFKPHPSPLDEIKKIKKIDFPRTRKSTSRTTEIFKLLLCAALAVVWGGVIINQAIIQLAPDGFEYEDSYPAHECVYDYYNLTYDYPEVATEVKPYYNYITNLEGKNGVEEYELYETYELSSNVLQYAGISATILYNDIYVGVTAYMPYEYEPWQVVYQISSTEINNDIVETMAYFTGLDGDSLYTFIEMSEEGYYEYWIEDGMFGVDQYDDVIVISYTKDLFIEE